MEYKCTRENFVKCCVPAEWVSMEVDTHKEAIQLELIRDPQELPSA